MAKKKKKKKDSELIQIQKLANKSAIDVQKMVNSANKLNMEFNAAEADKARQFNLDEANTTRAYNAEEAEKARQFNAQEAATARQFNAEEAEKARQFEKMMSDTSHQREVADLKAAGLNPVLSVNSGANSYTSASASAQAASGSAASGSAASSPNASSLFESGAAAFTGIMGSLLSGIVGLKQSQQAASATKYAANANLAAARESAAAMRYSASAAAGATKYSADAHERASKYSSNMAYKSVMNAPQHTPWGILDKLLSRAPHVAPKAVKDTLRDVRIRQKFAKDVADFGVKRARNSSSVTRLINSFGVNMSRLSKATQDAARKHAVNLWLARGKQFDTSLNWLISLSKNKKKYYVR